MTLTSGAIAGMASSSGTVAAPKEFATGFTIASRMSVMPIATRPMSMTRRFGIGLPVRVQEEDAEHRAESGGSHDEEEVLRRETENVNGEAGTDGTEHADQARG